MEESYRRIVAQIASESPGNRKLAETVLGWVLCAVRPLSVAELTDALSFLNFSSKSREALVRDIVYSCHGLIDMEKHGDGVYFRFVHFSACQFLRGLLNGPQALGPLFGTGVGLGLNICMPTPPTSPRIGGPTSPKIGGPKSPKIGGPTSPKIGGLTSPKIGGLTSPKIGALASPVMGLEIDTWQVQRQMADACMDYLCQRALKRSLLPGDDIYKCRQEFDALTAEQPFTLYASHAWVQHYREAAGDDDIELKRSLLQLFKRKQNLELSFQLFWFQEFIERFPRGSTPLHIASYFGLSDMISTLLARHPGQGEEYFGIDNYQRTPVYWAAFHGDVDSLERFGIKITRNDGIDSPEQQQMMGEALLAAIEGDQPELAENLLAAGANPNSHIRDGKGVLLYATLKGDSNLPMVRRLVEAGAIVEPEPPILSPLEAAAMVGSLSLATYYLNECHADVNAKTHQPFGLPLRSAVFSGHHGMVKLLLEAGADLVSTGEDELMEVAAMMGEHEVIGILLQYAPSHATPSGDSDFPLNHESCTPLEHNPSAKGTLSVSLQRKTVRMGTRQGVRMAKVGSPSKDTIGTYFLRVQRLLKAKFTNLDFNFLEALEAEMPSLVQEFIGLEALGSFIDCGYHHLAAAVIYMERNTTTPVMRQYAERTIRVGGSLIMNLIDNGCEGHLRICRSNFENRLIDSIQKRQMEIMEEMFTEIVVGMQVGVAMARHSLWLRACAKTFLAGITEMVPREGLKKFSQYLEGVTAIGLSPQARGGPAWRRMVVFIEIGYCAFAYCHESLYPKIHLKVAELRKALKDGGIQGHETLLGHITAISEGGRRDWEWDADESPWWHRV